MQLTMQTNVFLVPNGLWADLSKLLPLSPPSATGIALHLPPMLPHLDSQGWWSCDLSWAKRSVYVEGKVGQGSREAVEVRVGTTKGGKQVLDGLWSDNWQEKGMEEKNLHHFLDKFFYETAQGDKKITLTSRVNHNSGQNNNYIYTLLCFSEKKPNLALYAQYEWFPLLTN